MAIEPAKVSALAKKFSFRSSSAAWPARRGIREPSTALISTRCTSTRQKRSPRATKIFPWEKFTRATCQTCIASSGGSARAVVTSKTTVANASQAGLWYRCERFRTPKSPEDQPHGTPHADSSQAHKLHACSSRWQTQDLQLRLFEFLEHVAITISASDTAHKTRPPKGGRQVRYGDNRHKSHKNKFTFVTFVTLHNKPLAKLA